jgi:hypothetical protein
MATRSTRRPGTPWIRPAAPFIASPPKGFIWHNGKLVPRKQWKVVKSKKTERGTELTVEK